ncbi:sulfurtransferase [Halovenus sp. WSH3]|uniref:Sulfurtransferase n=1 Tax=Halovenus carboxidivorans TaxID=2692199 RepID=A0A6B0TGM9_9EURY|nr:rhodanese-like domain-containing protein [Halovenus carboxidivorans]MXR52339.1 sulfurtransferase [Halovenus carboxidivorans]
MAGRVVSTEWLEANRTAVSVVDVRREWEYDEKHVPGAVNVPYESFRDPGEQTPGKLPTAKAFGDLLGSAGIESDDVIVAYDGTFGTYASRFLLTAEVFGHDPDRLHLLHTDIDGWEREHATAAEPPDITPRSYDCERAADSPLLAAEELEDALDSAVIVDTRDDIEYDTVHIPGAINFQWRSLVDEADRALLPADELRSVLTAEGIPLDRPVRLYCNTARRLSFLYVVLRHLGHDDVAFYEGGIDNWADYGGPVETT